jgi:hypothetical protein
MESSRQVRRWAAAALVMVLLTAACGDDDTAPAGAAATDATTVTTPTTAAATTTSPLPAACTRVPFTVELRVEGEEPLEPFEVADAIAIRTAGGRAYTVYLADFTMDRDDRSYSFVTDPPSGGTVIQTGLTVFNAADAESVPVLAGGEIGLVEWRAGELATFLNVTAPAAASSSTNMTGSAELLHLDEDTICIEADITSERGFALTGAYTAEITADF